MSTPLASPAHRKYKSDAAADKALKQISTIEILEQINLFETVLLLYSIGALTRLEIEKLQNNYSTELTRKSLLVTSIIPGKGCYKGMRYLRRALKKTGQCVLLDKLDKAYEDAVDVLIAELQDLNLEEVNNDSDGIRSRPISLSRAPVHIKRRSSSFDSTASLEQQIEETSPPLSPLRTPDLLYEDVLHHRCNAIRNSNGFVPTKKISVSSSGGTTDYTSSDDDDEVDSNVIVLDNALGRSIGVNIQLSLPHDFSGINLPPIMIKTPDATPSPPSLPFRDRSAHISYRVNPRNKSSDPTKPNAGNASKDYPTAKPASFTDMQSVSLESHEQSQPNGRPLQDRLNNDNDKVSYLCV